MTPDLSYDPIRRQEQIEERKRKSTLLRAAIEGGRRALLDPRHARSCRGRLVVNCAARSARPAKAPQRLLDRRPLLGSLLRDA
jgi:hypothetical protein